RRASLAEIELELVEGRAERLYELALALAADLPVTVALDSKAERGFALVHPIAPQPVRARMVCVARDSRLGTALAGVAADCLRQIGANASRIATGSDSEFLHQLRVGVRRLRSLLKLTSRLVPGERLASLEEEVRWLGDAMSPARDWDVFANEIFPEVIPALHGVAERRDIDMLRRRITNMRRSHQEMVQEVAASPRLQRLLLGLGALFNGLATDSVPPADAPLQRVAALVLAERDRKLRKRGKRIQ